MPRKLRKKKSKAAQPRRAPAHQTPVSAPPVRPAPPRPAPATYGCDGVRIARLGFRVIGEDGALDG